MGIKKLGKRIDNRWMTEYNRVRKLEINARYELGLDCTQVVAYADRKDEDNAKGASVFSCTVF